MLVNKPLDLIKHEKDIRILQEAFVHMHRAQQWIDYHKARAEFAIAALDDLYSHFCIDCSDDTAPAYRAEKALTALKDNE